MPNQDLQFSFIILMNVLKKNSGAFIILNLTFDLFIYF